MSWRFVIFTTQCLPAHAGGIRDVGWIPGSGRLPGEEHGKPLQHSGLENLMDRGVWQATVHRVTHSQTRLKRLSMHACKIMESCISQWGLLLCIPSLSTVPLTIWLMFLPPRDGTTGGYIPSSWVKIGLGLSQAVPAAPMECGWRDPMWLLRFDLGKEATPSSTPALILSSEPRAGFVRKPRMLLDLWPMASISTRSAWSNLRMISVPSLHAFHFRSQVWGEKWACPPLRLAWFLDAQTLCKMIKEYCIKSLCSF